MKIIKLNSDMLTKLVENHFNDNEGVEYSPKLEKICDISNELKNIVKEYDNLPSWVQDKITIAEHNMEAIYEYLKQEMVELTEDELYEAECLLEESSNFEYIENNILTEAEYKGKNVPLGKPMRGDVKKYKVYVKNDSGNVVKVNFGDPNMEIKRDDPKRRKAFRDRHNCSDKKDRTTPGYWSCKLWSSKSVSDILKGK